MNRIPSRPDIGHLKKQAKALLALYQRNDPTAILRFRQSLPSCFGKDDSAMAAQGLRLHDAQSCVAREYGFVSWAELKFFVEARRIQATDPTKAVLHWLNLVYAGDITGSTNGARPAVAMRLLEENHSLIGPDPYIACAIGDETALRQAFAQDPGWVHRAGGPLQLPPLVAVTHSGLMSLPAFREGLRDCAKFLLRAGVSPNQSVNNRWPSASTHDASESKLLSALYGAAGKAFDPELTKYLLDAGANPNDGESLYHSLDRPVCTELLLQAGAHIAGTNAIYRVLDFDDVDTLQMLLAHGADANEPPMGVPASDCSSPLLWAIRRRRSAAHVKVLLAAGAQPDVKTQDGTPAHTLALRYGLTDIAQVLEQAGFGGHRHRSVNENFIAACACGDETAAKAIQAKHVKLFDTFDQTQLRILPELAAQGCGEAVKTMVALGWPMEIRGGDWDASALNHAVFRGDASLTRFLLERGADWQALHGFGDNALGTLSWASLNRPVENGDWVGCAQALMEHGMPSARPDPAREDCVLIEERRYQFADDVTAYLLEASLARG